jgi:hypothetical protein
VYFCSNTTNIDWSDIQTITISSESSSPSPSQTTTLPENPPETSDNNQLQQSEQNQLLDLVFDLLFMLGVGALLGGVVVAVVLVFTMRHLNGKVSNNSVFT